MLKLTFRSLSLLLGALYAWRAHNYVFGDGVSYLDMADALGRGDWDMVINGLWSPLYPCLLGMALLVSNPTPYWESAVASIVNFALYGGALLCFEFFWGELALNHSLERSEGNEADRVELREQHWWALGYCLFIWSSLFVIQIGVFPDMLVAAFVYLASGMVLRIRRGRVNWAIFIALGVVLGFSYLAKAPMFLLSLVFLTVSLCLAGRWQIALPRVVMATVVFFSIASIYFVALSQAKGYATFGDSWKVNYAFGVNGAPLIHWQGEPAGSGTPEHPTRKILDSPPLYEFATPIRGTYPPWTDPSYWYAGIRPHFEIGQQFRTVLHNITLYYGLFFSEPPVTPVLICAFLFLLLQAQVKPSVVVKEIVGYWPLLLPAVAALGMYALVHVEGRYVGPFVVLLWGVLFSSVTLPDRRQSSTLFRHVLIAITITIAAVLIIPVGREAYRAGRDLINRNEASASVIWMAPTQWQVAEYLSQSGIRPGDKVASIASPGWNHWARLAQVRVIAEIPDPARFWESNTVVRERAMKTFASIGAKAIVATPLPMKELVVRSPGEQRPAPSVVGWQRIGNSDYYVHILPRR
jgi:4-amino-4-deoxy-L-arabinose transferase-like glycosyltransferase